MNLFAAAWGLAEATLFFVVPDVLLTSLAVISRRRALIACAFALGGALLGGAIVFAWGLHHPQAALATLTRIPGIEDATLARVEGTLRQDGLASMFLGPWSSLPYKVYAVQSARLGFGLPAFLGMSIPARFLRFAVLVFFFHALGRTLLRTRSPKQRVAFVLALWTLFYVWFLGVR